MSPELSPAERYAASRQRAAVTRTALHAFRSSYPFDLDAFQVTACEALEAGRSVLVAAPTGAGKTVVGEFAVDLALRQGEKCFYTAPIKALSNQKFRDLSERYGAERVGLLTGDNSINADADVVVMTTEVLRNMLYARSGALQGLRYVVMDEVHYLADRFRGAVWEEVIIHLPEHVSVVALSATVSNAEEFGDWLAAVRGDTDVVVEEHRPVPLWQHVMVEGRLLDLFVDDEQTTVNPELVRLARDDQRVQRLGDNRSSRHRRRGHSIPRFEVIDRLERTGLLPVITFIFSRAGCDAAVRQCLAAGLRLTTQEERAEIRFLAESRTADVPPEDLAVLGYGEWLDGLQRGIAAHHAGMLPSFKEVVVGLFQRGRITAVCATETLALGINMPARSVALERLVKWNGEAHVDISPGEYTQLTGRAGRRGIDIEGHAVVVWHPGLDPRSLAGLASARTYPLRSSFRPSYNMAVNLVRQMGRTAAREVLETSFAQFQADRSVVSLAAQVRRHEQALEGYVSAMTCHLGNFGEYAELRHRLSAREKDLARLGAARRRTDSIESLSALRPGDVIVVPSGRRTGVALVLDPGLNEDSGAPRPLVLTIDRQVRRLSLTDFPSAVTPLDRMRIPRTFSARSATSRRDLANALRERAAGFDLARPRRASSESAGVDEEITNLRLLIRRHPCHGCDERETHARWAERARKLQAENATLMDRIEGRTNTIAREFDRVCLVLSDLGYLRPDDTVTSDGAMLGRLYTEQDLLAAECLRRGTWDELGPADLAAACAALVYESRGAEEASLPRLPGGRIRVVLEDMVDLWTSLEALERENRVSFVRAPDLGFVWAIHRWSSGASLQAVLDEGDLTPGDFVRWAKQVIDLLGQVSVARAELPIAQVAREAMDAVSRGVVSYTSVG